MRRGGKVYWDMPVRGAVMLVCRHKCAELLSWMVTHRLLCKHLQDTAVS